MKSFISILLGFIICLPSQASHCIENFGSLIYEPPENIARSLENIPFNERPQELTREIVDSCSRGTCTFLNFSDQLEVEFEIGSMDRPIPIRPVNARNPEVMVIEVDGQKKFFRPQQADGEMDEENTPQKAARTLAAARLNQAMGLNTVPKTKWARVNGRLGSLSDVAPGKELRKPIQTYINKGKIDSESLSNLKAFEFLVANVDGVIRNVHLDQEGKLKMFDHDFAFAEGLIDHKNGAFKITEWEKVAGDDLPDFYTQEFINGVERLTPQKIKRSMQYLLSQEEIDGIIFRRKIILNDIQHQNHAQELVQAGY